MKKNKSTYDKLGSDQKKIVDKLVWNELAKDFITEIQQALTDKAQGGTKLSVLEHSMLNQANEILSKVK